MSVFISVVVAVYNPLKEHIGPCLKALGKLQYPHDSHEIIIVDDGSTAETTEECLTQLAPDERRRISYVKTAHAGHPVANNQGFAVARGSLIALTDADCIVDSHWLQAFEAAFSDRTLGGAGGLTHSYRVTNWIEEYCDYFGSLRTPVFRDGEVSHVISANSCWRANVLREVEGFGRLYEEYASKGFFIGGYADLELSRKVAAAGYTLGYVPAAVAWHQHRKTLGARAKQFHKYGEGAAFLHHISSNAPTKVGRYDPGFPPDPTRILRDLIREAALLPVRPFTYPNKDMRIGQRVIYPVFDYVQRAAFCWGALTLYRRLRRLKTDAA
jgi:glycosyltransferase involved in cell wall biosynthesis